MRRYLSSPPRRPARARLHRGRRGSSSALLGAYQYLQPVAADVATIKDIRLQVPLRVYSRDGKLIAQFGEQRRIPLSFEAIPNQMVNAVLAAEDDSFFQHSGVDYPGLARATARHLVSGEKAEGGSTITMQLTRGIFLSPEKSYRRKLLEIFTTFRIEQELTQAGNPRAVSEQDVSRPARVRHRCRSGGLLRQDGRSADAAGDRADRRHVPAAVARQPGRERRPGAAATRLRAAAHAREGIHHAGRVRHRVERAGRIAACTDRPSKSKRRTSRRWCASSCSIASAPRRTPRATKQSRRSTAACRVRPCARCALRCSNTTSVTAIADRQDA